MGNVDNKESLKNILLKIVEKGGFFEENTLLNNFTWTETYRVLNYNINEYRKTHILFINIICSITDTSKIYSITLSSSQNIALGKVEDKKDIVEVMNIINRYNGSTDHASKLYRENYKKCMAQMKYKVPEIMPRFRKSLEQQELVNKIFE